MSRLVQGRYEALLVDARNNSIDRVLDRGVNHRELFAEVAEQRSEQAEGIRNNEVDSLLEAVVADRELGLERSVGEYHDLVFVKLRQVGGEAAVETHICQHKKESVIHSPSFPRTGAVM